MTVRHVRSAQRRQKQLGLPASVWTAHEDFNGQLDEAILILGQVRSSLYEKLDWRLSCQIARLHRQSADSDQSSGTALEPRTHGSHPQMIYLRNR